MPLGQIHLKCVNFGSPICLSSAPVLRCSLLAQFTCIYMTYLYSQILCLGSIVLPQSSSPGGFPSALPIGFHHSSHLCRAFPLVMSQLECRHFSRSAVSKASFHPCNLTLSNFSLGSFCDLSSKTPYSSFSFFM